jgi:hypothetical protein
VTLVEDIRSSRWATQWMTIDLRALGAFRIALAFTILIDVIDRARAFSLYTNDGPMPFVGSALAGIEGTALTFHRGPPAFVAALFVVQALLAVAFALGWRTRIVAVVLLAFVVSLQARCPLAFYLGDDLTRVLLFWSCVLPVGARFSVDSARSRAPGVLRSFAAGGLVLVPATLFFFTGLEKIVSPEWRDGRAIGIFADTWIYPTTIGAALRESAPSLFPPMTVAALVAEMGLPLLLLMPWWRVRLLGAVGLFALMFGIAVMLDVGLFPLATATALVPLVPSEMWSRGLPAAALDTQLRKRRVFDLVALACALTMIATSTLTFLRQQLPAPVTAVLQVPGLSQRWSMFIRPDAAPRGWFLVAGRTDDGRDVDVLRDAPLDATHVPAPMSTLLTFRERCVLQRSFVGAANAAHRPATAAWLCRASPAALRSISVGYADVRGEPPAILVIELVKDQACPAP